MMNDARYQWLVENITDALVVLDQHGVVSYVSPSIERISGFRPDELTNKSVMAFVHPEDLATLQAKVVELFSHDENVVVIEVRLRHKDSSWKRIRASGKGIVGPNGVREAIVVAHDVTLEKSFEDRLRKLSIAVEQSPVSVVITDVGGTIEYVNPKFEQVTGYTKEEALGQNPRILKSGEQSADFYKTLWSTITAGKPWHGELHNRKKDGTLYWESATISPIVNEQGVVTNFLAVKEDITARKEAEAQLQQKIDDERRLNELTVGRELKMIELKEELARLKEMLAVKS